MSPKIYAVVFTSEAEKGSSLLKKSYKDHFKIHDGVVLVASEDLSSQIARASGLTKTQKEKGIRGAVFKLSGAYTGFAPSALWEWLEVVE